jgi:hypothetical protein
VNIAEILFKANIPTLKKIFANVCHEYETNPKYRVKKIYEDLKLVGFWVYVDEDDGYRNLLEGHYIGKNRCMALKMFREMTFGATKLRAKVQKVNDRVWKTYLRIGFKIVQEDLGNYILQRGK